MRRHRFNPPHTPEQARATWQGLAWDAERRAAVRRAREARLARRIRRALVACLAVILAVAGVSR